MSATLAQLLAAGKSQGHTAPQPEQKPDDQYASYKAAMNAICTGAKMLQVALPDEGAGIPAFLAGDDSFGVAKVDPSIYCLRMAHRVWEQTSSSRGMAVPASTLGSGSPGLRVMQEGLCNCPSCRASRGESPDADVDGLDPQQPAVPDFRRYFIQSVYGQMLGIEAAFMQSGTPDAAALLIESLVGPTNVADSFITALTDRKPVYAIFTALTNERMPPFGVVLTFDSLKGVVNTPAGQIITELELHARFIPLTEAQKAISPPAVGQRDKPASPQRQRAKPKPGRRGRQ